MNKMYCLTLGPMRFDGLGLSAVELIESMMEQDAAKRIPLNEIQRSSFMVDYCDNASVSRDWSAMGDRASFRSQERRRSREFSRERRTEFDRAHGVSFITQFIYFSWFYSSIFHLCLCLFLFTCSFDNSGLVSSFSQC
ncbi:hypothetical protein ANCCAN_27165 [Ancylostoma caninum]|uniref:Uncharacterized protein n=1 Tax=Ancylostoma caninum TaxID=29170 RepID=A0A368F4Q3_ANCCA|nr:hypothetical protein ANCCAN_27165 [Ancylostoma caninum]